MIKKFFRGFIIIVLLLAVGLAYYLYSKLPDRSGEISLPGLSQPVIVNYDSYGIPHIEADNKTDLMQALGYVHAQDRLFQMELLVRLSQGRLAEVLGPELVEVDQLYRRLSIHNYARTWAGEVRSTAPPDILAEIDAYLKGVNQLAATTRPLEFDVMGIPAPTYQLEDILSVTGYMSWSFAQALKEDPVVEFVATELGNDYLADLGTHRQESTLPIPVSTLEDLAGLADFPLGVAPFVGSNGWVLSGDRTESGSVLFANDPHMGFAQPSVWYEAHLKSPEFEIYGHHLALIPFALLGHNQDLAWGLTMFENDDMDLYLEKPSPVDPDKYLFENEWLEFSVRQELIGVKGEDPLQIAVRSTHHGPVINDSFDAISDYQQQPVSLRWEFLQPGNRVLEAFWSLPAADTLEKASDAASKIYAPGLNLMYGNKTGDIAWFAAARLPDRPEGMNTKRIQDGSSGDWEITSYKDFSDNPKQVNPAIGYVYSANNQPGPVNGQYEPGYYAPRDRAERITTWMVGTAVHNSDSMKLMLLDSKSPMAEQLIDVLKQTISPHMDSLPEIESSLAAQLFNWNTSHEPDEIEPAIYNRFRDLLQQNIFKDELPAPLYEGFNDSFLQDRTLWQVTNNKNSPWWDNQSTAVQESWKDIVALTWTETVSSLTELMGGDTAQWQWKNAAVLIHDHPLSSIEALAPIFSVGPFQSNGGVEVINNLSVVYEGWPYKVGHGPSTRRIIDLSSTEQSWGINPTGQSGVVVDSHYRDQAAAYAEGVFRPQWMGADQVKQNTDSTLIFIP